MEQIQSFRPTLTSLVKALTADTKTFFRQEVQLAKTEISEKVSRMSKNAVMLAVGGFVAYAGAIVLLIGLGWLAGWGFEAAGLAPTVARALGITATGLIVAVVGYVMLQKGLNKMKSESLAPERTIQTLQELGSSGQEEAQTSLDQLDSEQLQQRVEATETRMGDTLDELGHRLNPSAIKEQVGDRISANPYRAGLIAMGVGVVSGLVMRRKFQRA